MLYAPSEINRKRKTCRLITFLCLFLLFNPLKGSACEVKELGSLVQKPCKFPFSLNGQVYTACTDDHDPAKKKWCSTKVDEQNRHIPGKGHWGYCDGAGCEPTNQDGEFAEIFGEVESICGRSGVPSDVRFVAGASKVFDISANFPTNWPWMVSLGFRQDGKWNHNCGGTIITRHHILTAAHCAIQTRNSRIRVGDINLQDSADDKYSFERTISEVHIHPLYDQLSRTSYYDVAVMKIDGEPLRFNLRTRPVCLPTSPALDSDILANAAVTLTGWGRSRRAGKISDVLRRAQLTVFSQSHCNDTHTFSSGAVGANIRIAVPEKFTNDIFCAGYEVGGPGSCKGDSGGPLVLYVTDSDDAHYVQHGIVQGGVAECGAADFPGIFVRTADPHIHLFIKVASYGGESTKRIECDNCGPNIFSGTMIDGVPNGHGIGYFPTSYGFYEGEWRRGSRHGQGKVTTYSQTGTEYERAVYEGGFENGVKSGRGTLKHSDGTVYIGGFKDGQPSGDGYVNFTIGASYKGGFANGLYDGEGTLTYACSTQYLKSYYEGMFKNGKQHGEGFERYCDGDTYKGSYVNGARQGSGKYVYNDGVNINIIYIGRWKNGKENGQGIKRYANGDIYMGNFVDNVRNSDVALMKYDNDDILFVSFKNDVPQGTGLYLFKNGSGYTALYVAGNVIGEKDFEDEMCPQAARISKRQANKLVDNVKTNCAAVFQLLNLLLAAGKKHGII